MLEGQRVRRRLRALFRGARDPRGTFSGRPLPSPHELCPRLPPLLLGKDSAALAAVDDEEESGWRLNREGAWSSRKQVLLLGFPKLPELPRLMALQPALLADICEFSVRGRLHLVLVPQFQEVPR